MTVACENPGECQEADQARLEFMAEIAGTIGWFREQDDQEGLDALRSLYGETRFTTATHIADCHSELAAEAPGSFEPGAPLSEEQEQLYLKHSRALEMAAERTGWRTMPDGGVAAIEAGVVVESDPTWMYSDDHRASNGFTLTNLGRKIMVQKGHVCGCPGCRSKVRGHAVTLGDHCSNCRGSIGRYGGIETDRGTGCRMHCRNMEKES